MKQGIIISYILLAIIALLVCPLITETAPVSGYAGKWKNPCEVTPPSFEPYNTTNQQKADILSQVIDNLHEAENMIINITNEYRVHRVANEVSTKTCVSNFDDNLDNFYLHVNGFPDLSSYFLQRNIHAICKNITATLLHDYENLVAVMIFLEETIKEEYDENSGIYGDEFKVLHDSIKGVMCKFHVIEQRCGIEEQDLNATDIVDQYKVSSIPDRNSRDYLLIRDMAVLVRALLNRYTTCHTLYSKSST